MSLSGGTTTSALAMSWSGMCCQTWWGMKMTSRILPVRAQYAVILAYCGDFAKADREMASLAPYEAGLAEDARKELQGQRALIAQLRKKMPPPPQWQMPDFSLPKQRRRKIRKK